MKKKSADEIYIYVLRLENGKYYVGQTNDLKRRFRDHLTNTRGAQWTRLHRPIEIVNKYRTGTNDPDIALKFENERTLRCIEEYNWWNVRGGDYIHVDEEDHYFHLIHDSNLGNAICPIVVADGIEISNFGACVFTLELEQDKYFIGTTKNINLAIISELEGRGADWTSFFKPSKLVRVIKVKSDQEFRSLHHQELKRAFVKYKADDVRGGRFNLIHPDAHWRMLKDMFDV